MSQPGFGPYLKGGLRSSTSHENFSPVIDTANERTFSFFRTLQSFAQQPMFELQIHFPPEETCALQRQSEYLAQRPAERAGAAASHEHPAKSSKDIEKHTVSIVARPETLLQS
ncbi:uncharacterized protein SRS1_16244 [Sporisorium reilianum f. sp. reilianum]|uniref:Uncharacterized protein n=1 Tax=Sporisorium reilianum f. sp. reilianum TaxID=72559 RepID=A0A2N8UL18_9BASI|nr:uncharacterized protein SRS1_16244 [Sporisorium reilianum f. sp. reilianum]